jgi:hypothetical protein
MRHSRKLSVCNLPPHQLHPLTSFTPKMHVLGLLWADGMYGCRTSSKQAGTPVRAARVEQLV